MGDSLITIVAIFLAATLMFVFPLAAISEMNDNEAQSMLQAYTTEYVDSIRSAGKITKEMDDGFVQRIATLGGNSYEREYEVQIPDTNPGKKNENQQIGDTTYYGEYTSQVESQLNIGNGVYTLIPGAKVTVTVRNTNTTISQMLKSVLYGITGNQAYVISAQASGMVTAIGY